MDWCWISDRRFAPVRIPQAIVVGLMRDEQGAGYAIGRENLDAAALEPVEAVSTCQATVQGYFRSRI